MLFARSRGGWPPLVVTGAVALIAVGGVPIGLREVPLSDGVALVTLGISSVAPAFGCLGSLVAPGGGVERMLPRWPLIGCRGAWVLLLTVLVLGTEAATTTVRGLGPESVLLVVRSALLGLGLVLLCAVVLRPAVAWLPLALLAMVSWLCGTVDLAGTALWWALLSHPVHNRPAAVVAGGLWLSGVVLYALRDAADG
ncbi:MAG TPA: hypothetical protein VGC67_18245 [Cellulomonas sp.]